MSIRTNPMKAIPVLLKRVRTTKSIFHEKGRDESLDSKLEKLTRELNKIEDVFMRVKKNQDDLLDTLHEVGDHLRKLDRKRLDQDMDHFCRRIRDCAQKLLPMDTFESDSSDDKNSEIVQSSSHDPSSSQHHNNHFLLPKHLNVDQLQNQMLFLVRHCLISLLVFPKDAVIKKRHAIYWWIGRDFVGNTIDKTTEEAGEDVIDELLRLNLIVPYGNAKCPVVNKFQIHPHIRPYLEKYVSRVNQPHLGHYFQVHKHLDLRNCLVLEQQKVILGDGNGLNPDNLINFIFNIGTSYLNFGTQWLDKKSKHLRVLQLGQWQNSPSHHIEVGSEAFLQELRLQTNLRYLSLCGISRIFELPASITQLESLEILDLEACHNLETLPNDISSMKSLTHLILSKCYLLDGMPKGIGNLTQLQVLKGFLIGSSRKTPCRVSDLANLKKLRRLSIRIGSEAVIKDREFESLRELSSLEHLKISWGVSADRYNDNQIIFPTSLKRLHLECFPGLKIPEWLKPSKLSQQFEELKITGGNLESMSHDEDMPKWIMEIVRLRYLRHLKVDLRNLRELFPLLRYAEMKKISNHSYFEWSID